jgi:methylamine dehydrogenase accessory protein MauD
MESSLVISNLLLWVVVILLMVIVFALARQIGVLHERVAPVGALMPTEGPKIGELIELNDYPLLDGSYFPIGGESSHKTLIYFLSPTCPICKSLLPIVLSIAGHESDQLRVVFASDGDNTDAHVAYAREHNIEDYPYVLSQPLGMRMGVNKLPFAVLINEQGVLRGRGLVNNREHLESLLQADEMNVSSLQDYLGITEKTA